jgi:ABC-type Fe3+-hydroxamate transport system substrate-binding protein
VILVAPALLAAFILATPSPQPSQPRRPRIVSLVPSLTEDLFAIGAGAQVVGTSQFSDYPAPAARLPQVASAGSIDAERIVELHPDVVVGIPSQASQVAMLRRLGMRVELMADDSYDDIFRDLAVLGRISGHTTEASALTARLAERARRITQSVRATNKPRCFVVLGVAPIFTVGDRSYIAHLIGMAGGRNAAFDLHSAYGRYSAEVLLARQPDVLIGDPQGGLGGVLDRAPWNALRAVREHHVYILGNADILERPGPRFNDGLAWLVARLHQRGT